MPDGPPQMIEVILLVGAMQGRKALRGQSEFVRYGQPDPARSEIDGQDARWKWRTVRRRRSSFHIDSSKGILIRIL
jgi:hypothetical protein